MHAVNWKLRALLCIVFTETQPVNFRPITNMSPGFITKRLKIKPNPECGAPLTQCVDEWTKGGVVGIRTISLLWTGMCDISQVLRPGCWGIILPGVVARTMVSIANTNATRDMLPVKENIFTQEDHNEINPQEVDRPTIQRLIYFQFQSLLVILLA